MLPINTPKMFETALKLDRAILFCHAEWSLPSVDALRVVEAWDRGRVGNGRPATVPVLISRPYDQPFLDSWLISQGFAIGSRGCGETFWLEAGRIVAHVLLFVTADALSRQTAALWPR